MISLASAWGIKQTLVKVINRRISLLRISHCNIVIEFYVDLLGFNINREQKYHGNALH